MKMLVIDAIPDTFRNIRDRCAAPWEAYYLRIVTFRGTSQHKKRHIFLAELLVNFIRFVFNPVLYERDSVIVAGFYPVLALFCAKWASLFGVRKRVYLLNFMFYAAHDKKLVQRILGFLMNRDTAIMAYSPSDAAFYRRLCPAADIRFYPWCADDRGFMIDPGCIGEGDYFFAGGFANRNYDLLVRCARRFPAQQFCIVTSAHMSIIETIPGNVRIQRDIPSVAYHELLAGSKAVIIPLKNRVGSSGQMNAIAAMRFGKATIYPDQDAVSQYFDDGINGILYQTGDEEALAAAISRLCDTTLRHRLGKAAREKWEQRYTPEKMGMAIMDHMSGFLGTTWKKLPADAGRKGAAA